MYPPSTTEISSNEEEQQNQQVNDVDSKMKASGAPPAKKPKADCSSEMKMEEDKEGAIDVDEDDNNKEDECHPY